MFSAYAAYPAWASFSMLCARQYHFHCVSTFMRPRSVKRSSRLFARRFPNTGSTVASRCRYYARPEGVSIRSRIAALWSVRWVLTRLWKDATLRTGLVSGVRRHFARSAHGPQLRFAP